MGPAMKLEAFALAVSNALRLATYSSSLSNWSRRGRPCLSAVVDGVCVFLGVDDDVFAGAGVESPSSDAAAC